MCNIAKPIGWLRKGSTIIILGEQAPTDDGFEYEAVYSYSQMQLLAKLVYIPGVFNCDSCNFRLVSTNFYVKDWTFGPNDNCDEKCPNCDKLLNKVSWKDEANSLLNLLESQNTNKDGGIETRPETTH